MKISIIPIKLCEFKTTELNLVAVYGYLRVQSLKSIRNLDLLLTIAIGYVAEISGKSDNIRLRAEIIEVSKHLFGVPNFVYYTVANGVFEILKAVRPGIGRPFFCLIMMGSYLCFLTVRFRG